MENQKTVIEINGVKLEVDLTTAKKIENYKIGDNVRVLIPQYEDKFKVCPGVIVSFDNFIQLPTISVAYLDVSYSSVDIKFAYINSKSDDRIEIAPAYAMEDLRFGKAEVLDKINKEIDRKQEEIKDLQRKISYFESCFNQYFIDKETEKVEAF